MAELRVTSTGTIKLFESDDTSSVTIASPASLGGDRTITLPDANVDLTEVNTMPIANLDIDGGTDIGANIADSDLLIIDDGAGGTNRKTAASRLKTYVGAGAGAFDIANLDIDGGTDIGAAIADSDLFIIDDGAGGTNRKTAASRLKTYIGGSDFVRLSTIDQDLGTSQKIQFTQVFSSDYDFYRLIGRANVGSAQQALIYFRWLNSSNSEQTAAEYHYAGYGRYSSSDDAGGNVAWQAMGETSGLLVTDFYGGSYNRTMFYDMTFYPKVNSSPDRSAFQGQISYNAYNSGNGGWNATSVGGTYNSSTDLSGGGLQIECNTSYDYVTMSLYGVKLA